MTKQLNQLELRQIDVELRGQTQDNGELRVSGYVNKTNQWSQPLGGREQRFIERIEPGTFERALEKGNDVLFLAEHDNAKLLASTKNGSLTLREDENGLYMEAEIAPTSWGRDYHTLIERGLVAHMSFGMKVNEDAWEKRDDMYERTISDIHLAEVSVVKNPAYIQSNIQARSIELIEPEPVFFMSKNQNNEEQINMSKEKELRELLAQAEKLADEVREGAKTDEVKEVRAVKVEVNKEEQEIRGVEEFIKGNVNAPETRTLTTATGAITIPVNLSNQIIERLVEQAALFGRAKGFSPVSGNLEILKENDIGGATFIGEMEDATKADFTFDKVVLEQRRAATAIELSQQLVNDSGINIIDYATGVMTRRLAREMDKSVLTGNKANKQFEGLLTDAGVQTVASLAANATDAVLLDALLDMTLAVHPDHLENGVFVVGRPMFNKIAKVKDANGQYHLVKEVVNGRPVYKLFGHEVLIQDNMPALGAGAITAVFVNMGVAYATMVKRGAQFKRISDDTTNALKGTHLLMLDVYADGKIINNKAIKFLKQV